MDKIYANLLQIQALCNYANHCNSAPDGLALDGMTSYFLESRMYENVVYRITLLLDDCFSEIPDSLKYD